MTIFNYLVPFDTPHVFEGQFCFDMFRGERYIVMPVYAIFGFKVPLKCAVDMREYPDEIYNTLKSMDARLEKHIHSKLSVLMSFEGVISKSDSKERYISGAYPLYIASIEKCINLRELTIEER